jgi:hypothetical protein
MESLVLARKVAQQFAALPQVQAIALGGSQASGALDAHSDIDLYIYSPEIIPLDIRQAIVAKLGASRADLNLTYWDVGDEWFDLKTGIEVDAIYWSPGWIEEQLERVLVSHQASLGYTTCFWRTVKNSQVLFDRQGWYARLQRKCQQPYPQALKQAILAKNYPVLRDIIPSYYTQIKKALERGDLVSLNHRLAALFASYFDVLFALNAALNPGEKKVLRFVRAECERVPPDLESQVEGILLSAATGDRALLRQLDDLLDGLQALIGQVN